MKRVIFASIAAVVVSAKKEKYDPWRDPTDPAPCDQHKGHNDPRTTFAPTCDKIAVPFKLCRGDSPPSTKFYNNLAGGGPDTDKPEEFRIFKIAKVEGINLDLVVSVGKRSTYSSHSQFKLKDGNGAYVSPCPPDQCKGGKANPQDPEECVGAIPFRVHSHTKFHWKWVKTGTNKIVEVEHFELMFTDLDHASDDNEDPDTKETGFGPDAEWVEFGTHTWSMEYGPKVHKKVMPCGAVRISSAVPGKGSDNVAVNGTMTQLNEDRSVTVGYKNRGEFYLTMGHEGPVRAKKDRLIEFTGSVYVCK